MKLGAASLVSGKLQCSRRPWLNVSLKQPLTANAITNACWMLHFVTLLLTCFFKRKSRVTGVSDIRFTIRSRHRRRARPALRGGLLNDAHVPHNDAPAFIKTNPRLRHAPDLPKRVRPME